ncbi:MAG: aminotransferase class III-fold pyridoxal phosphate-dependent enzyme, partial [Flavobacteriales bacterium]
MNFSDQNIWHPFTQYKSDPAPIHISHGKNEFLYDKEGNEYIDAVSSWWVNTHGHAHPYIIEKVHEQHKKLEHVIFAGFTHDKAIELSEKLLNLLPNEQNRVFFSDNGSTATEAAVKMALQYWHNNNKTGKNRVIAFDSGYHGDTFGAMSVTGYSAFNAPFQDKLF